MIKILPWWIRATGEPIGAAACLYLAAQIIQSQIFQRNPCLNFWKFGEGWLEFAALIFGASALFLSLYARWRGSD